MGGQERRMGKTKGRNGIDRRALGGHEWEKWEGGMRQELDKGMVEGVKMEDRRDGRTK
jgi:hypothetical protein